MASLFHSNNFHNTGSSILVWKMIKKSEILLKWSVDLYFRCVDLWRSCRYVDRGTSGRIPWSIHTIWQVLVGSLKDISNLSFWILIYSNYPCNWGFKRNCNCTRTWDFILFQGWGWYNHNRTSGKCNEISGTEPYSSWTTGHDQWTGFWW